MNLCCGVQYWGNKCPNCGYCPCCGRSNYNHWHYPVYNQPIFVGPARTPIVINVQPATWGSSGTSAVRQLAGVA